MVNRCTLFILIFGFTLFSCQNNQTDKRKNVVGGWSQAEIDDEVIKAADFAQEEIESSSEIEKISEVKTQIVSGKNYDITFMLSNGEKWNVIVYRNIRNEYELIKSTKL